MLNVDKGIVHVDNRLKKLEKPSVQQIQDARLRLASFLNRIRRSKSAPGYQNAELKRLAFLRLHLTDAMFSNARSASLLRYTRPTSLQQNLGLIKFVLLKCRQTNAIISNESLHLFSAEVQDPRLKAKTREPRLFYKRK